MRTAILLSGGVDSSVALMRLLDEGHDVTAFYLKVWLEDELSRPGGCPWEEDVRIAREVCRRAGVPLEVVALQRDYRDRVLDYALSELREGRTPSPDIFCNRRIKFGAFVEHAGNGFERVASGHYARIRHRDGVHRLLRAADPAKDQTYFLSRLTRVQLARCWFPIGDLHKSCVRDLAGGYGLPNRDRPDSQGLCFLGRVRFDDFVRTHLGDRPGPIVDAETGRTLGEHRGYWFHTIGQRRGLGLSHGPWYVVDKDVEENTVLVSHADHAIRHARSVFQVTEAHWIHPPRSGEALRTKIRHGERTYGCRLDPGGDGDPATVTLDEPDPGVAPGQFAVFYRGEECLGGARIS